MESILATLTLRPTRIGFLVDPSDAKSVHTICQISTCLWGGRYNPIIPVCEALPEIWHDRRFPVADPTPQQLAQGYADFFEPDVFVESKPGLFDKLRIPKGELEFGHPRVISLESFSTYEGDDQGDLPFGLNIYFVYRQLYEREFQFVTRHERRVAIFESSDGDGAFIAASFGEFPTEGSLRPLADAYRHAFDPVSLAPNVENWVRLLKEGFEVPLDFTDEKLRPHSWGWRTEPRLFIVDPASTPDIIDLWNIRQFHPYVIGVPLLWFEEGKDFIREFVRLNHRPLPGNPTGMMIQTTLQFGRSISDERAKAAIAEVGLELPPGGLNVPWTAKLGYDRVWNCDRSDFRMQPRRTGVSASRTDLEFPISTDDQYWSCQFRTVAPDMAPLLGSSSARWVNVLTFNRYGLMDDFALTLPSSFTDLTVHRLRINATTIITREGWVLPQRYKDHGEYLRIPSGKQAMIDWLINRGVTAEPSDPGRIADQILGSLKGFWGVRIIADRDTLKLLNDMSKSVRRFTDGKVEEFPDRAVEVKRWRDLVSRRSNSRFAGVSLEEFVSANILRLGLGLQCTHCYKNNWFGIESLRTALTCERCLKTFDFPQGSLNFDHTPWQYRVVGPYSMPDYAQGAYATILALNVFARTLAGNDANVTYATGLNLKIGNEESFEVDFSLWYQRQRVLDLTEEPVLVFGESKSFAAESFKAADLERMRRLGEMFPGAFLAFTTLKDELSENERTEIGRLAMWGRQRLTDGRPRSPVIVLTGTEAFAGWKVEHTWEQLGDRRAEFARSRSERLENLWTFATMTQEVYLNLPDRTSF